jgi:hypothetical protein
LFLASLTTPALKKVYTFNLFLVNGPPPDARDRLSLEEEGGEILVAIFSFLLMTNNSWLAACGLWLLACSFLKNA